MDIAKKPSPGIIGAAIVAILGSATLILFAGFAVYGLRIAAQTGHPPLTPTVATAAKFMMLALAVIGVFGICVSAGLLVLKNWARIAILIISGVVVAFSALALIFVLVALPNTAGAPPAVMLRIRVVVAGFYTIPIAIGVWWLILFTRKPIVAQFDALSWSPEIAGKLPEEFPSSVLNPHPGPKCPIAMVIIAWIGIVSSATLIFSALSHSPVVWFGRLITGPAGVAVHLTYALVYLVTGIGILKLNVPSFWTAFVMHTLSLVSGAATLLLPNLDDLIRRMHEASPHFGMPTPPLTPLLIRQLKFGLGGALLVPITYLIFFALNHSRFMRAAAEKAGAVQPAEIALQ